MKQPLRATPSSEKIKELRTKMIEHLEHAVAAEDAAGDCATNLIIETALERQR